MRWRKLKLLDKIIIVSGSTFALFMLAFWLFLKRPNKDYYLPLGFEGWVTLAYQRSDADPPVVKNGAIQISVSDSGYAETRIALDQGWGRDRYFWVGNDDTLSIPGAEQIDGEYHVYIHGHQYHFYSHEQIIPFLKAGKDTLLWDGTRIERKSSEEISYQPGKKVLEFFYVSGKAESILFNPPENPSQLYLKSTEDYHIRKK